MNDSSTVSILSLEAQGSSSTQKAYDIFNLQLRVRQYDPILIQPRLIRRGDPEMLHVLLGICISHRVHGPRGDWDIPSRALETQD